MKITEIQKLEDKNQNSCFLIKDGIFWLAYEKSAMIFVTHIKPYAITKKFFKVINTTLAYLGFPDSTFHQIKEICAEKGYKIEKGDKVIEITEFDAPDNFLGWKEQLQEKEIISVKEPEAVFTLPEAALIGKIRSFPVAERTPMDCQHFIIELQSMINGNF